MTDWQDKVWGRTRCVIETPFYSRHELEIIAGTYCSLHYHQYRANRFIVSDGHVQIIEMYGPKIVKTNLFRDNVYDVPSLVPHMFVVYKSGAMVEEYYVDRHGQVKADDINRFFEGGILPVEELSNLPTVML